MSLLTRFTTKLFGGSGSLAQTGVFGSTAAGTPTHSLNPGSIQSLPAWTAGWQDAVVFGDGPVQQDMEGYCYVTSYELNYLFQQGIPEYTSATVYGSYSVVQQSGQIFISTTVGGSAGFSGQAPGPGGSYWTVLGAGGAPTVQKFTTGSGTYTTPANVKYVTIETLGGGAGGAGAGSSATAGGSGFATSFGTLVIANGGAATSGQIPGVGGSGTIVAPATGTIFVGNRGAAGIAKTGASLAGGTLQLTGGNGGPGFYGGGAAGAYDATVAADNAAAPGAGGGGGATTLSTTGTSASGAGGAAGGYVKAMIVAPAATYPYSVGNGGGGGTSGADASYGSNGADGLIIVTEYYS